MKLKPKKSNPPIPKLYLYPITRFQTNSWAKFQPQFENQINESNQNPKIQSIQGGFQVFFNYSSKSPYPHAIYNQNTTQIQRNEKFKHEPKKTSQKKSNSEKRQRNRRRRNRKRRKGIDHQKWERHNLPRCVITNFWGIFFCWAATWQPSPAQCRPIYGQFFDPT